MPGPNDIAFAVVDRGIVVPNAAAVSAVVNELRQRLRANPALMSQFQKDPRLVLGAFGLSEDVQTELIREARMILPDEPKQCTLTCWHTCWFTDCAFTHWA
jgi:hypothetical protein